MNASVLFYLVCYVSAIIGYLLRWSYGEQQNLVLLFWALAWSMFSWTFLVERSWQWRLGLLVAASTLWGVVGAHWTFRTYPHPFSSIELLLFVIPLPVLPHLFLLQLPSGESTRQDTGGVVQEMGWFRKATIVSGALAVAGIFMFLGHWLDARAILYRLFIGFLLLMPAVFAAGWVYHRGYISGWTGAKNSPPGAPAPLDVRGRARLLLLRGGKPEEPSKPNEG